MMAQKHQKKFWWNYFCIFECLLTLECLLMSTNSLDSSRSYERLLENQKTGGSRELFLPENNFQTSSTVSFPKKIQISEVWKTTRDMKFKYEFFCTCPSTYELNIM